MHLKWDRYAQQLAFAEDNPDFVKKIGDEAVEKALKAIKISELFKAGIWPITLATTILKPGGYQRLQQLGKIVDAIPYEPFTGVRVGAVALLSRQARASVRNTKPVKPQPERKLKDKVPLFDCFTAPCTHGCPIHQDIPQYIELVGKGDCDGALKLIVEKNPLPFITGTICPHRCADKCTRHIYEESIRIRRAKLTAAENGLPALLKTLKPAEPNGKKVAVIGGGPAGLISLSLAILVVL